MPRTEVTHGTQNVFEDGKEYIFLAQNELYWSRINRGPRYDPIEAAKVTPDIYSRFRASVLPGGKVALMADIRMFLSRINRGALNPIEAA